MMRFYWLVLLACEVSMLIGTQYGFPRIAGAMRPHTPEIFVVIGIAALAWQFLGPPRALLREMRERLELETIDDGKRVKDPRHTVLKALRDFSMAIGRTWPTPVGIAALGFMLAGYHVAMVVWLPFFVISIAITLTQFPRLGAIAKLIEKAKGVRCEL